MHMHSKFKNYQRLKVKVDSTSSSGLRTAPPTILTASWGKWCHLCGFLLSPSIP